ncbi:MAG TPA: pitrilysin family protein [Acidobacteriota bacterium]|nr:pitrilysin family protein [Acidobacteriota bacterium]
MDVQIKQMRNGLVVVSEVMPHLRSVSIGVWVKSGSRFEESGTTGISHFIEHLLFKGTRSRSAGEIAEAIDSVGGQLNAFTEKEYVGFYAKVLDEHLPFAFELLSDIVLNPTFPTVEMNRERNVIFEEINMIEDSPQELVQDIYMENFWKGHPLGRPISGTKKSVARIARKDVIRHFNSHYTAKNTIISVAGNVRHGKVYELARRYFSDLAAGNCADLGSAPVVSPVKVVRHKAHLEQAHICLGTASPPLASEERFCAHLLCNILGGGMSSRLFQNIREKRGLVYSIFSGLNLYHDAGALVVYAGMASENASAVIELTLKEFKKLRQNLVPTEELKRAKENIKGSIMLSLESSSSRMTHLAQQQIYFGRCSPLEEILEKIDRVRAREIRQLANRIFVSSSLTLTALGSRDGLGSVAVRL